MQSLLPRYVLIAETQQDPAGLLWRFALHAADSSISIAACDQEPDADEERLALMALVRGLEAIDHPAEVTVVTRSASVVRGVNRGLDAWRNNHWRWERFGRSEPIRDADLWRRVDHALRFHTVTCRSWGLGPAPESMPARSHSGQTTRDDRFVCESSRRAATYVDGRSDSPAMVIVRSSRTRRRVRLAAAG